MYQNLFMHFSDSIIEIGIRNKQQAHLWRKRLGNKYRNHYSMIISSKYLCTFQICLSRIIHVAFQYIYQLLYHINHLLSIIKFQKKMYLEFPLFILWMPSQILHKSCQVVVMLYILSKFGNMTSRLKLIQSEKFEDVIL